MKMNQENMGRFEGMVRDWANDNNLKIEIDHDWDSRRTALRFKLLETRAQRDVMVYWDTKKSLSQAGALIFSHITREFNLDAQNTYLGLDPKDIKDVIFNKPATIILWNDGTKTVVKCQDGDEYSEELGLAMCIAKKALGNKGNFNDVFKKWVPETKTEHLSPAATIDAKSTVEAANDILDDIFKSIREKLKKRSI